MQYKLVVRSHFVAPLIRKRLLPDLTVSFSATIGDSEILGFDTGIRGSFHSLGSTFPVERTRIYCPSDAPDFSYNKPGSKRQKTVWIRRVAATCKKLARRDIRSLVVFISDAERQTFLKFSAEEHLSVVSYGNGVAAKDAAAAFKGGQGDVLVGSAANYAEGLDLPKRTAPMIFYLRPGFPNPNDAMCQFEARKFSQSRIWALRRWRETLRALQVRGRNVRSDTDVGLFVGVDKRLRGILQPNLPAWLEKAYVNDLTFDQCIADAIKRLGAG